jgi:hypothetical protein
MADQSIKPADLSKSGLGGFDLISKTNKKFMEITTGSTAAASTTPPKKVIVPPKKSTVKITNKSNTVLKQPMKKETKVVATAAFKFPWDK